MRTLPSWACGVTTIPKRMPTLLGQTLKSLAAAGFETPRLFIDGMKAKEWAERAPEWGMEHLSVTLREPPVVRVAGNWILTLYEMLQREPEKDMFAVFQDDVTLCKNVRQYLDRCIYPDGPWSPNLGYKPGYWNLYSAPSNERMQLSDKPNGWHTSNQLGHGALALVFSRQAATTLLGSYYLAQRCHSPDRGWRAIDGGIACAMTHEKWTEYVHKPSLVDHTGTLRSFCTDKKATGREEEFKPHFWEGDKSLSFNENFDALELLKE